MALHRFPIVVWQDAQGYFTALVVSDAFTDPPAATALAEDRARLQLKDYLDWLYAREPWRGSTDLIDVEVAVHSMRGKLALCDFARSIMKRLWMLGNSRKMCARGGSRSIDWSISS
jgi:hypothetical protein